MRLGAGLIALAAVAVCAATASGATTSAPTATTPSSTGPVDVSVFAGQWYAGSSGTVINSDGSGQVTGPDLTACPSCSPASAPQATIDFKLAGVTATSRGYKATGVITAESDPAETITREAGSVGTGFTAQLDQGCLVLSFISVVVLAARSRGAYGPCASQPGTSTQAPRTTTAPTTTTTPVSPPCRASADISLEQDIHKFARVKIGIPANAIRLPSSVTGQVSVGFELGDAQTCKNLLSTIPSAPGIFTGSELSFSADGVNGTDHYGPFKYDAPTVSWVQVPDMPQGQDLVTHFDPLSAEASLNVHPSLQFWPRRFGGKGLQPALTVAEIDLHALAHQQVTLVQHGLALLQVSLGPTIVLEAQVSPSEVVGNAEDAAASGDGDTTTAADDAAEVTADDLATGVEEAASEFYGVDIQTASRMLYDQLEPELASALEADLVAFVPPPADVVPDPAVTAADAGAVDGAMGAGAVEFEESDVLLVLLL